MFKLDLVFSGLVFFAQPPAQPTFTNAVLVTGPTLEEHHSPEFKITKGTVKVMKDGKEISTKEWSLGPNALVTIVNTATTPPTRLPNFLSHVPSVGAALKKTPLETKTLLPCVYADTMPCANQQGRIRLSGGSLDADVPRDDPEYPFLTPSSDGEYHSRLTSRTTWTGTAQKITIAEGGSNYEITATTDVTIVAGSHPSREGAHFRVLRHLYSASGDEFPEPLDTGAFFRRLKESLTKGFGRDGMAQIMTLSRPILCPPAAQ